MRRALVVSLLAGGCCLGGASAPTEVAPTIDRGCHDLCQRIADCDVAEGRAPTAPDCARECSTGGVYASLPHTECALEPSCALLRQCAGPALAITLLGSIATAEPTVTPPDWPSDFPTVPGGVARAAPSMGPVRVALIAYANRDLATTERAYRGALTEAHWTIEDAPAGDGEAHRFVAAHEAQSVSVSIYTQGTDTIVQTMQLGASEH